MRIRRWETAGGMATDMSQHFTMRRLFRATLPSIGMMLFKSLYVMTDGLFVSNWAGSTALAAVNFVWPVPMFLATVGFMLGTGGSAIVARTRGAGDEELAQERFTFFAIANVVLTIALAIVGLIFLRPLMVAFRAEGEMLELAVTYGSILLICLPFDSCQLLFQNFFATAGKPGMGFANTAAAGITNIALDAIFVGAMSMGVTGAAIATIAGEALATAIPLIYFSRPNTSSLRFVKPKIDLPVLAEACFNGSSEFVSNVSSSLVSMAFNVQLLAWLGDAGVAAYSIILYFGFAFNSIFIGYSIGCAPLMGYNFGAGNTREMRSLFRRSLVVIGLTGLAMFAATQLLATPLSMLFVRDEPELLDLTVHAFTLYSGAFLIMGFNIYGSSLFTSLSNGIVSAFISFMRTIVFEIGCVYLLPLVFGADGIWYAMLVAEAASFLITAGFALRLEPRYGYWTGETR